ncbi:MAG TPA: hypothetical protein EYP85_11875 [Armatimonadetes bacterium]|nr:hypothetical protein [Armatimonadota bacterium]
MAQSEFKVALVACDGIGRLVSTVVRQAAYKVMQQRPEEVILVDTGMLLADQPEALEVINKYPVVVIDGCRPRCGTVMTEGHGVKPAVTVYTRDVVAQEKISLVGEQRRGLGEKGMRLAEAVAQRVIEAVDLLIAEEMVSTL